MVKHTGITRLQFIRSTEQEPTKYNLEAECSLITKLNKYTSLTWDSNLFLLEFETWRILPLGHQGQIK